MTKNEFKNGDLVLIDTYDTKVKNANGEYDYFVVAWDKDGNEKSVRLDVGRVYQIDATNVMPIHEIDDEIVIYPLKDINHPHYAKFYVPGDCLVLVNENEWLEDDVEDDSDATDGDEELDESEEGDVEEDEGDGETDLDEIKEFANISKNISFVIDSLESVLSSLTKILENRK